MDREKRRRTGSLRFFAAALLAAACAVGFAAGGAKETFAASRTTYISDAEELKEWYEKREPASAKLKKDLIIKSTVSLRTLSSAWEKELDVDDHGIYIMDGGSLTIDNMDFRLTGEERMIVVDSKGVFRFLDGTVRGDGDKTVIAYKADSQVTILWNKINLTGNAVSSGSGAANPSGGAVTPQVLSVGGGTLTMACMEGTPLSSLTFPVTLEAACLKADGKTQTLKLPVVWDVSGVSTRQPGVYRMKGTFPDAALGALGLTNPGKVTAELLLSVLRKEDAGTLNVRMISEDSSGNTVIRLEFPMLTSDVTALYLYYSADGTRFTRESWAQAGANGAITQTENFLGKAAGKVDPPWQYLEYKCRPDGPFWLQIEVVGSALAGKSNIVACDSLEEREPGRMHGGLPGSAAGSAAAGKNDRTGVGAADGTGNYGVAAGMAGRPGAPGGTGTEGRSGSAEGLQAGAAAGGPESRENSPGREAGPDGLVPGVKDAGEEPSDNGGALEDGSYAKGGSGDDYAEGAEGLQEGLAGGMDGVAAGEWDGADAYMDGAESAENAGRPSKKTVAVIAAAILLILAAAAAAVIKKRRSGSAAE